MILVFYRLLFVITMLICTLPAMGKQWFVATTGNNANAGTISQPFLNIQKALDVMAPGDTVWVRGGTYSEKLVWKTSGSSGHNSLLSAYNSETVVVDGGASSNLAMIYIDSKSFLTIRTLTLTNNFMQDAEGIHIVGTARDIAVESCKINHIGWSSDANADPYSVSPSGQSHGILVNGRTVQGITNVSIRHCQLSDLITGNSEALTLVGNVNGFEVSHDTIHHTKNIGIVAAGHYAWAVDPGVPASLNQARNGVISHNLVYENRRFSNVDAPAGIYVDGGRDILVFANVVYNNGNGLSLGCENGGSSLASFVSFFNNRVYQNDNHGIVFGANAGQVKKCVFRNNTCYQNGTIQNWTSEVSIQKTDSCQILQNILIPLSNLHYAASIFGYTTTQLTFDNNLAYRYTAYQADLIYTGSPVQFTPVNTLVADPQMVNPSSFDFGLLDASVCINSGLAAYGIPAHTDAVGNERLVNGNIDLGALENTDGGCPGIHTVGSGQLLDGIFTASQKVVFASNATTLLPVLVKCPDVQINSPLTLHALLTVQSLGCN
jgi:hypothetical protein